MPPVQSLEAPRAEQTENVEPCFDLDFRKKFSSLLIRNVCGSLWNSGAEPARIKDDRRSVRVRGLQLGLG